MLFRRISVVDHDLAVAYTASAVEYIPTPILQIAALQTLGANILHYTNILQSKYSANVNSLATVECTRRGVGELLFTAN